MKQTPTPTHVPTWRALAAVTVACLLAGSAAAADRVVLAEAFVDDG